MADADAVAIEGRRPPRWLLKAFTRINVWVHLCERHGDV